MSTLTHDRVAMRFADSEGWPSGDVAIDEVEARDTRSWPEGFGGVGDRLTLDELLAGAWEGLSAHSVVACPLCGGPMEPTRPAPGRRETSGGRCRSCGTALS